VSKIVLDHRIAGLHARGLPHWLEGSGESSSLTQLRGLSQQCGQSRVGRGMPGRGWR
jgi:hypothetical protein